MDEVTLRCDNARARTRDAAIAPFVPNELRLTVSLRAEVLDCDRV